MKPEKKSIVSKNMHLIYTVKKEYEAVRELPISIIILNFYPIIILSNSIWMHQISTNTPLSVFLSKFKKLSRFCSNIFCNVVTLRKLTNLINVTRGRYLWNEFLTQTEKGIDST